MFSLFNKKSHEIQEVKRGEIINVYGDSIYESRGIVKVNAFSPKERFAEMRGILDDEILKRYFHNEYLLTAIQLLDGLRSLYTYQNYLKVDITGLRLLDIDSIEDQAVVTLVKRIVNNLQRFLKIFSLNEDDLTYHQLRRLFWGYGYDFMSYGGDHHYVLVIPYRINEDEGLYQISRLILENQDYLLDEDHRQQQVLSSYLQ
jgi:hypothetical protein|nr:MAG TPA: hypothetical protein [Bacteriophage sp.]